MSSERFLVVIDPSRDDQPALERAAHLARCAGARLTLFLSIFDFSYEMTSMLSQEERDAMRNGVVNQRRKWLEQLAEPLITDGLDVTFEVVWHNRPFESIINHVLSHDVAYIIKSTHAHDKLKSVIFTPTDWHLLRKAPVPVLLVKEHDWPADGTILAAVNVAADDEEHQELNDRIVDHAVKLATLIDARVHLVNGYPGTPVNIAIELPDFDAHAYNQSIKQHHTQRIEALADRHGIDHKRCHVLEGLPEDVIPELARELDAELVMLGTVGRSGLSAALIGNTAEHVIDSLECDLVAFKPKSFVCPLAE
ncbi:universal stress protein UspE [Ferrimonas sediminicola]|uniref:Universal stress protein UspE n=1 Tax=Ferrimonas sediminicola TaxID=2569538 RepID=A0A4U1BHE5_9GAMM|nr:universal stress protein UspE [Ferrimonas sediminicola]TKB50457.1 universal stress protein UspE [Ferrimonas sediminicola]